jgi:hypothetical protein
MALTSLSRGQALPRPYIKVPAMNPFIQDSILRESWWLGLLDVDSLGLEAQESQCEDDKDPVGLRPFKPSLVTSFFLTRGLGF